MRSHLMPIKRNKKRATQRKIKKRSFFQRFFIRLMTIFSGLVTLSILLVLGLRWIPPPTTAFLIQDLYQQGKSAESIHSVKVEWSDWADISPHIFVAVIVSEDQRFFQHHGFDVDEIQKAWAEYQGGKRLRGASTITQQLAKNLFLWSGRSVVRKGLEAYFTIIIELLWPKNRILEIYVNIIQYGQGVYGVTAASEHFFHKPPSQVTPREAALLAAVLPNPLRFRIDKPSPYVKQRQEWIIRQMNVGGGIKLLERGLSEKR
ncbi:monofunctional biosynthetic peptidoglycan transglycosylase [candidate division CSSED10-310 bacterium]|uniref:Biosynthetic peptidoglycan transglycosylase n=1 Tax=candidate division CSSED10-310 bacterium TaxID=2855610 RepID=A0ABV6YZZ5_UNCC1